MWGTNLSASDTIQRMLSWLLLIVGGVGHCAVERFTYTSNGSVIFEGAIVV